MTKTIAGICPIVAATFTAGGRLDEDSFQGLVRHLMGTGAHALTLFGLATEFYKLTDGERETMQRILLAETTAHPVVAGIVSITDHSWEVAVLRARRAQDGGADALMVLPPYFLAPAEDAIIEHIARVAAVVEIPVIVQYAPTQTGVRLAPTVFLDLAAACPNVSFVKVETQPPGRYISALLERGIGRLATLVGSAGVQMPDVLARGAAGVQPGCSFTEIYVALWRLWREGDGAGMRAMHARMLPYIGYWMQGIELIIQAEKTILQRRGIIAHDYCRAPGYNLDAMERDMVGAFLDEFAPLLKHEA